jgi:hypothetical protein
MKTRSLDPPKVRTRRQQIVRLVGGPNHGEQRTTQVDPDVPLHIAIPQQNLAERKAAVYHCITPPESRDGPFLHFAFRRWA